MVRSARIEHHLNIVRYIKMTMAAIDSQPMTLYRPNGLPD